MSEERELLAKAYRDNGDIAAANYTAAGMNSHVATQIALLAIRDALEHRSKAIRWANQSVEMLQEAFFPISDALRDLEAYLRNTPHHNAIEASAARKALAKFDAAATPHTTETSNGK